MRRRARIGGVVMSAMLAVILLTAAGAQAASPRAATPSFSAHVSAKQVYVTGLAPHARMSLLSSAGRTLSTEAAPVWSFSETKPASTAKVSIEFSKAMPSSLILPSVPGVSVPTGIPPCHSRRNEPCQAYVPTVDRTATH